MSKRKIIRVDDEKCNGCGNCAIACAEGAIELRGGKAKVVSESFCDGLGACLGECPTGALTIEEREAPEFDEASVKRHLGAKRGREQGGRIMACPSSGPMRIPTPGPDMPGEMPGPQLSNWPIQLRLAHPDAPYFRGARLLIAADCSAFSYAAMHSDFIRGRVTIIACPKLDDSEAEIAKLAEIFARNEIKEVKLVHMEVPCCAGLEHVVRKALQSAAKDVPVDTVVIGIDGGIVKGSA